MISGVPLHPNISISPLLQVHGHHPPPAAAHVLHGDQGGGGGDLGPRSAAGPPSVLLLQHGPAARPRGLLHRLARVQPARLQKDVSVMFNIT